MSSEDHTSKEVIICCFWDAKRQSRDKIVSNDDKSNKNNKTTLKTRSGILQNNCETETNRQTGASGVSDASTSFHRAHGGGMVHAAASWNLGCTMS